MNNKYLESLKLYHMSQFSLYISNSNIVNSGYGVFTDSFILVTSVFIFLGIVIYLGELGSNIVGRMISNILAINIIDNI
jgi:hypothetical protein